MPGMGTQKRALRASCDNCHQAKVKCVPTAAGCQRCLGLSTLCVHSPPGRSGRVPTANRESGAGTRPGRIPTPPRSSPSRAQSERNAVTANNDETPTPSIPASSTIDFTTDSVMMEPVDSMISDWFSMSAPALSPIYSGDPMLTDSTQPPLSTTFNATSHIPTAISDFVTGDMPSSQYPYATSTQQPPLSSSASSSSQLNHLVFNHSPKLHPSTCTCFQTIVRALEKIQKANMRLLSMDVALSQNKEALIHICNALKCTSPHDSTTRLLMLVLLRKNLNLYHLLYQSRLRYRRDRNHSRSTPGSPFSSSSPPWSSLDPTINTGQAPRQPDPPVLSSAESHHQDHANGEVGGTVRLSLGSYQLDYADESSLTKQILLLDVNKVPRLLERLDRRACGLDEADGLDLYNMMRSALIAEFRAIMTEVET